MKRKSVSAKWIMVMVWATAVLTACAITNNPTPQAPLAEVVTVERPPATPPPSSTPTATRSLVETAVPTSTLQPTLTPPEPTPTFTPLSGSLIPDVSSQGQLAYVQNQVLFVETAVGSSTFKEFGNNAGSPLWSPQGDKLIFETCTLPGQIFCEDPTWMLYVLERDELARLTDLFPNLPPGDIGNPTWLNSGEKLLFRYLFDGSISVLDFNSGSFSTPIRVFRAIGTWELPHENLLVHDQFGTWANELHAFALDGTIIWSYPNPNPEFSEFAGANAGVLGFSEEGQLLVILEPDENLNEFAVFYHFDPESFEIERLFSYQLAFASPSVSLSPNGQFVALYVPRENAQTEDKNLLIVDQNGRSYGQRSNSVIMDWRPDGGPVVQESVAEGQTQLAYWPLEGAAVRVFVNPTSLVFGEGKWGGDGRFFIYSAVDETEDKSYLYLWQPESGEPTLLHTAEGTDGFRNFVWLPDSTGVYFNSGRIELWKFEVETESLTLIASSTEN